MTVIEPETPAVTTFDEGNMLSETEIHLTEILEHIIGNEDATQAQQLRVLEAILFAASAPLDEKTIALHMQRGPLGEGADVPALLKVYREQCETRGIQLVESSGRWSLRSATDLADYLKTEHVKPVKLSRAMAETLAIIAYHQPVTRAEVETIRGVATSKGTLDYLMMLGWVRPGRRRETPGRPLTWVTTPAFLDHFGLGSTNDLPGVDELRAAGLLDAQAAATYGVIAPSDEAELPPAIEGLVESEPEFLPSEETLAEQAAPQDEETEDPPVEEQAAPAPDEDNLEDDEFAEEDDISEQDESDDGEGSDDEDDDDDFEDSDDDDFDDDEDDDDDEMSIAEVGGEEADTVATSDIDAAEIEKESQPA
jgi:segregation and condensation protein B